VEEIILNIPKGFTVMVQDESVFLHDALIGIRMWTPEGKRPIVVTTGSHQKTCVFGTITFDGRQLFRQYDTFNQYSFISYLGELKRKFRKMILFLDRAPPQHCRFKRVKAYLERKKEIMM
jgi:DDE superfamily endonuclease